MNAASDSRNDHMAEGYGHVPDGEGLGARFKHAVNRHAFQQAGRIVAFSEWARTSFVNDYGVDPERVVVIGPGVDTRRWTPRGSRHGGSMRPLFVGGGFERKGGDQYLRAFRALPHGVVELVVVTQTRLTEEPNVRVVRGGGTDRVVLFRNRGDVLTDRQPEM